jgi:hypothetical protein
MYFQALTYVIFYSENPTATAVARARGWCETWWPGGIPGRPFRPLLEDRSQQWNHWHWHKRRQLQLISDVVQVITG